MQVAHARAQAEMRDKIAKQKALEQEIQRQHEIKLKEAEREAAHKAFLE